MTSHWTRKQLLQQSGGVLAAATLLGPLSACGGSSSAGSGSSGGKPSRGGTAEVSVTDSSTTDRLNPIVPINTHDILAMGMIYDGLTRIDLNFKPQPGLAESWEPNADGTVWEFTLRNGVTFHDGKTLTPEDVVWTLQQDVDPKGQGAGLQEFIATLDPSGIKAVGKNKVRFTLKAPNFFLPQLLGGFYTFIAQANTKSWNKPPGTGPFVVQQFQPGGLFYATRNENYWDTPAYLDGVRLVDVPDQATKVETVTSGTAHLGDTMETKYIKIVQSNPQTDLVRAPGGNVPLIVWQGDKAPFTDVRVRNAMKLLVDRQQIVDQVYFGHAAVSADLAIPPDDPFYPTEMGPPARDVEQAKSLLKQAGQSNLAFTTWTSQFFPGMADIPVLFKEQAAEGGVTVNVQTVQPQTYLSTTIYKHPSFMDAWLRQHTMALPPLLYTPGGPYNETHINDPRIPKLFAEAVASNDFTTQKQKVADAARLIQDEISQINPCGVEFMWPRKKSLQGIEANWATMVTFRTAYLTE
jgi:peptide/nickel transport system substrate-binding protein